jgi:hypothetical protein
MFDPERIMEVMEAQSLELAREVAQKFPGLSLTELSGKIVETWKARPCEADIINLLNVLPREGFLCFQVGLLKDIKEIYISVVDLKIELPG